MHGMGDGPWYTDEGTCRVLCNQIMDQTTFGKYIRENGGGAQDVLNKVIFALMGHLLRDRVMMASVTGPWCQFKSPSLLECIAVLRPSFNSLHARNRSGCRPTTLQSTSEGDF